MILWRHGAALGGCLWLGQVGRLGQRGVRIGLVIVIVEDDKVEATQPE